VQRVSPLGAILVVGVAVLRVIAVLLVIENARTFV